MRRRVTADGGHTNASTAPTPRENEYTKQTKKTQVWCPHDGTAYDSKCADFVDACTLQTGTSPAGACYQAQCRAGYATEGLCEAVADQFWCDAEGPPPTAFPTPEATTAAPVSCQGDEFVWPISCNQSAPGVF